MSAYILVKARITDPEKFAAYAQAMPAAISAAGGEYLVLGGAPEWLEGAASEHSYVISRWPSKLAAKTFWESPAYADIRPLREGCGEFEVLLLDGLEETQ